MKAGWGGGDDLPTQIMPESMESPPWYLKQQVPASPSQEPSLRKPFFKVVIVNRHRAKGGLSLLRRRTAVWATKTKVAGQLVQEE